MVHTVTSAQTSPADDQAQRIRGQKLGGHLDIVARVGNIHLNIA